MLTLFLLCSLSKPHCSTHRPLHLSLRATAICSVLQQRGWGSLPWCGGEGRTAGSSKVLCNLPSIVLPKQPQASLLPSLPRQPHLPSPVLWGKSHYHSFCCRRSGFPPPHLRQVPSTPGQRAHPNTLAVHGAQGPSCQLSQWCWPHSLMGTEERGRWFTMSVCTTTLQQVPPDWAP